PPGPVTPVVVFVVPPKKAAGTQIASAAGLKPGPMQPATPVTPPPTAASPPAAAIGDPWVKPPVTFTPTSQLAQTAPTGFNPPPAIDLTPVPLPRPRPRPTARPKIKPAKP